MRVYQLIQRNVNKLLTRKYKSSEFNSFLYNNISSSQIKKYVFNSKNTKISKYLAFGAVFSIFVYELKKNGIFIKPNLCLEDNIKNEQDLIKYIEELEENRKKLEEYLKLLESKFKALKGRLDTLSWDEITPSVDQEWVRLSVDFQVYMESLQQMMVVSQNLKKSIESMENVDKNLVDRFNKSFIDNLTIQSPEFQFIRDFKYSIQNAVYSISNGLSHDSFDPEIIVIYLTKKLDILNKVYKDCLQKINLNNFQQNNQNATIIFDQVNKHVLEFAKEFTATQHVGLYEALNQQRSEIETAHSIELNKLRSDIISKCDNDYKPILADLESFKAVVTQNNSIIDSLTNNVNALKNAYALNVVLLSNDDSPPLSHFINSVSKYNDPVATSIIAKFPRDTLSDGVSSEATLFEQLSSLKKESQVLVFSGENPINPWQRLISTLHSKLRLKDTTSGLPQKLTVPDTAQSYYILDSLDDCIQSRDLIGCIERVSLLTGNSRKVFDDWIKHATDRVSAVSLSQLLLISLNNQISRQK